MSTKNKNPYKRGNYNKLFAYFKSKQVLTRQALIEYGVSELGMTETEASASATVILSPREVDGRGDCRGSFSAQGHLYFVEPLAKKKGEPKRFRLRYRKVALEPRQRPAVKSEVKAKVKKTSEKTSEKASAEA